MNFFAHSVLAAREQQDPHFVFGAMLPDFQSICRGRVVEPDDRVTAGMAHHQRVDAWFHYLPEFEALCKEGEEAVAEAGPGAAVAVPHVGVELLIDGELTANPAHHEAYLAAIEAAQGIELEWKQPEQSARWLKVRGRMAKRGVPTPYRDPAVVTRLLEDILAHRPRLAMRPGSQPLVQAWLESIQPRVRAQLAAFMAYPA